MFRNPKSYYTVWAGAWQVPQAGRCQARRSARRHWHPARAGTNDALRRHPDSLQYLLTDLFKAITLWDVRTERASVERADADEYRVTIDMVERVADEFHLSPHEIQVGS